MGHTRNIYMVFFLHSLLTTENGIDLNDWTLEKMSTIAKITAKCSWVLRNMIEYMVSQEKRIMNITYNIHIVPTKLLDRLGLKFFRSR